MAHRLLFYPVGNGDTSQIILENGRRILFDYHHCGSGKNTSSPIIDLASRLKKELTDAKQDFFDVVAFTHGDSDHIKGSTEFFELLHAAKYQGSERIKIKELWVPAAMILETAKIDEQSDEFVIWRQEARYRLIKGKGVRVFSKPEQLKKWLEENGLTVESRKHLITDAGTIAPGFSLALDEVEFFCHSPFIKHVDDADDLRNSASLIFNIRFTHSSEVYNYFAVGDTKANILADIVNISENHGNSDRLEWDIFNIPHHCSYLALNEEDKGDSETTPHDDVEKLLLKGNSGAYMICSSNPIGNNQVDYEQIQPPHIQAKNCYVRYLKRNNGGQFLVTMEEPNKKLPEPIEILIGSDGIRLHSIAVSASSILTGSSIPRAGKNG